MPNWPNSVLVDRVEYPLTTPGTTIETKRINGVPELITVMRFYTVIDGCTTKLKTKVEFVHTKDTVDHSAVQTFVDDVTKEIEMATAA